MARVILGLDDVLIIDSLRWLARLNWYPMHHIAVALFINLNLVQLLTA